MPSLIRTVRVISMCIILMVLTGCSSASLNSDRIVKSSRVYFEPLEKWGYKSKNRSFGWLYTPVAQGPHPVVILLHTCGGASYPHLTSGWPIMLAENGYAAFVVESYVPRGYLRCTANSSWRMHQTLDAYGALIHLREVSGMDAERGAVIGFSAGGFAINDVMIPRADELNLEVSFKAAISVYARCFNFTYLKAERFRIPLLQIAAEKDKRLASSCIDSAKAKPFNTYVLKGAYHAFDAPQIRSLRFDDAGNPMLFSAKATKEAHSAVLDFLSKNL